MVPRPPSRRRRAPRSSWTWWPVPPGIRRRSGRRRIVPCQLSNTNIPPLILSSSGVRGGSGGSICTVTLILWPGLTVEGLASAIHTNGLSSRSSCCGLEWAPQGPPAVACWAAGNGRDGLDPATGGPLLNKMRSIGRAAQMISSLFLTPGPVRSLRIPSNNIRYIFANER